MKLENRILRDERLQRIADLVAHVGVADVKAKQHKGVQFAQGGQPLGFALGECVTYDHEAEDQVGRVAGGHILPALQVKHL